MSWSGWWKTIRSLADVSKTIPSNGQTLVWNSTTLQYEPATASGGLSASDFVNLETPTPAPDGSTTLFTANNAYVSGSLQVFRDQSVLTDDDFTETDPNAGTFTLDEAPDSDEIIRINYIKQ